MEHVEVSPLPAERFVPLLAEEQARDFERVVERGSELLAGRVVWNVNSTARGGGVAELLSSLVAYVRGARVDCRWVVIDGDEPFFHITKRIHNRLHGAEGDGGPLGDAERADYERVSAANAVALLELVSPDDVVLLHDPQTAGLAAPLRGHGAHVVWRCHVGLDTPNDLAREAWRFLLPEVEPAEAYVFSREAFAWEDLDRVRLVIVPPSIDPFSAKNQELPAGAVGAILAAAGLAGGDGAEADAPVFHRHDGTPGRVDRQARLISDGVPPTGAPLVAQVSRWDRLKDPLGVMEGFARHIAPGTEAQLVLAGPDVTAVADDPEGAEVLAECERHRARLEPGVRGRVHLALLPMEDAEENAAIVNALQSRSDVVVQKSLAEGFGLTVAEAMWKGRPVVAGRVGGIQDQIADGVSGVLVDPRDLEAYGQAVTRLLLDDAAREAMGEAARTRVREHFLGARHLTQYLELFERLLAG